LPAERGREEGGRWETMRWGEQPTKGRREGVTSLVFSIFSRESRSILDFSERGERWGKKKRGEGGEREGSYGQRGGLLLSQLSVLRHVRKLLVLLTYLTRLSLKNLSFPLSSFEL
jgi:hypothetical protein